MKPIKSLLFIVIIFFHSHAVAIVNIEDIRNKSEEGTRYTFDLSANGASGISNYQNFSLGAKMNHSENKTTSFLVGNYDYGKSNDVINRDKSFLHARHIRDYSELFASEVFVQTQKNEFARLSSRHLIGGGGRFSIISKEKLLVNSGLGLFYEKEVLIDSNSNEDAVFRMNAYAVIHYKLNNNLSIQSTSYYQPDTSELEDYRISENLSILNKASSSTDIKMSLHYSYDSRPPLNVKPNEFTYTVGIVFSFQ